MNENRENRTLPRIGFMALLAVALAFLLVPAVLAHSVGNGFEVFARTVSANPDTKAYTFSCNSENPSLRDWFIRPDGESEEAVFLDKPASQYLTYTFQSAKFYHVGCIVVDQQNFSSQARGDLHIDLRPAKENPEIYLISGNGLTVNLECRYTGAPYTASWEVINAYTGQVSSLPGGKNITHTVAGHGLYDYVCKVSTSGQTLSTGVPIEFFDAGDPYFPDTQGIPHGVTNVWVRDGTSPPQNTSITQAVPQTG